MTKTIEIRKFAQLGGSNLGWLNTRHHFSFADHFDPQHMHWGALRVINDDIIRPGGGFPAHPHRSMEIITYILPPNLHPATHQLEGGEGVKHEDSTGATGITEPGDVQVMSVGSEGVIHSEFHGNSKSSATVNLFQIWIIPDQRVTKSTWGTKRFADRQTRDRFTVFASGFDEDTDALPINSKSRVVGISLSGTEAVKYQLGQSRLAYAVVSRGQCTINGVELSAHDGAAIQNTDELEFRGEAEVLIVDTHELS